MRILTKEGQLLAIGAPSVEKMDTIQEVASVKSLTLKLLRERL